MKYTPPNKVFVQARKTFIKQYKMLQIKYLERQVALKVHMNFVST